MTNQPASHRPPRTHTPAVEELPAPVKRLATVAWISARHSSPCSNLVASSARITFALLMSAPSSLLSSSICSSDSSVKSCAEKRVE